MGGMKELWITVHDQLIEEYAEENPDCTDEEAIEATVNMVDDRIADIGDAAYDRWKDIKQGLR